MKIYRDADGKVINIGEWDLMPYEDIDEEGNMVAVITNPIPEGVTITEENVVSGWDGGLYATDDSRQHG